jgi:hypothetical protein
MSVTSATSRYCDVYNICDAFTTRLPLPLIRRPFRRTHFIQTLCFSLRNQLKFGPDVTHCNIRFGLFSYVGEEVTMSVTSVMPLSTISVTSERSLSTIPVRERRSGWWVQISTLVLQHFLSVCVLQKNLLSTYVKHRRE